MTALVPRVQRVFHAPEIWLILQALGAVPASLDVPPEITTDKNAVAAAQANLLKQGSLLAGEHGQHIAAPEIAALVGVAAFPESVIVASVADNARFGNLARLTCFSWTPQATVINWVDPANDHHFESFAPGEAKACVWEHLVELCDLNVDELDPPLTPLSPSEMEREVEQTRQTVLLMATQAVRSSKPIATAISWFVSGRRAWLLKKNGPAQTDARQPAGARQPADARQPAETPQAANPTIIRESVQKFVGQALPA